MSRSFTWVVAAALAAASTASAAPYYSVSPGPRAVQLIPPPTTPSEVSPFIYLNRCTGGCTITGSLTQNSARDNISSIPGSTGTFTLGEYAAGTGQCSLTTTMTCTGPGQCPGTETCNQTGTFADAEWAQLVKCVQEVYSPFAITVSDSKPPGGQTYTESLTGGNPSDVNLPDGILGVSPSACQPVDNLPVLAFANHHGLEDRVNNICWTVAQETAHAFGLDHEYSFISAYPANGNSACMDPMTYRVDCGGQKFFRNAVANDGRYSTTDYSCSFAQQNSHTQLLNVLGPGTPITSPPTVAVTFPAAGLTSAPAEVVATAASQRGVFNVDLYLNGFMWGTVPGAAFGNLGQPESQYTIQWPHGVPNGVIDIVAKAYDDLGTETDSAPVTITVGQPCMDAATDCAAGQTCSTGRCSWPPPSGQLGDTCTYPQFCVSLECEGPAGAQTCTVDCDPRVMGGCDTGYDCVAASDTTGFCLKQEASGGCCSAARSGSNGDMWVPGGLGLLVLGLVFRKRKQR